VTTTFINRLVAAVGNTPGLSGSIVVGSALNGRRAFSASDDGKTFDITIEDGSQWEERTGCVYTHSTRTLTRGTLDDSNSGSAISLSAQSIITVSLNATWANKVESDASARVVLNDTSATTVLANSVEMQSSLTRFGKLRLTIPGIVWMSKTVVVPSGAYIYIGAGVEVKLAGNSNCNMFRNTAAGVLLLSTQLVRSSNVVTVTEEGHPRAVGDKVSISNLLTDTSFNGVFTITSVTANSWTFASVGSNGSPTNLAFVNPANEQLAGAAFSSASNVVTVTQAGHTKRSGNPIHIEGLTGNTSFNGNFQVVTVTSTTWTYVKTSGTDTAPGGTAVICSDNTFYVGGPGKINGNEQNQTASNNFRGTSAQRAIIFGNAGTVTMGDGLRGANVWINWAWFFNCTDVICQGLVVEGTHGDFLHFEAPMDRIKVRDIQGDCSDDLVAFTNTDANSGGSFLGYASPSGLGNGGTAICEDLYPTNSPTPAVVKWTFQAGYNMRALIVRRIGGSLSSAGLSGVAVVDDTASLTGGTLDYLEIDTCTLRGGSSSSRYLLMTNSGVVRKVKLMNITLDATAFLGSQLALFNCTGASTIESIEVTSCSNTGTLSSAKDMLLFNAASTVNDLTMSNCRWNGNAGQGNVITQQNNATITTIFLDDVTFNAVSSPWRQNGTGPVVDIFASNVRALNCAVVFNSSGSLTIWLNNCKFTGTANNDFQVNSGTLRVVGKNLSTTVGKTFLLSSGTWSYSCPDPEGGLDLGNPAASLGGQSPIIGDQIFNTNANVAAKGLTGRTAVPAWVRVF